MRITGIWRYPIKSHGAEQVSQVALSQGKTMPWDRHWAVAHSEAKADGSAWAHCANFSRGAKAPKLVAMKARLDEQARQLTLTHPELPDFTFWPDDSDEGFLDWVCPIMPTDRAGSARIVSVPERGMTDTDYPSISLLNNASLADLSRRIGQPLDPLRFRGNLWFDGMDAWAEFDLVGKRIRIGEATLTVTAPITRCLATTANPQTGERDADTLGTLNSNFGHQDFGIYVTVDTPGTVKAGDKIEILS